MKYNDYYNVELKQVVPFVLQYGRSNGDYVQVVSEVDADILLGKKNPNFRILEVCYANRATKIGELDVAYGNDVFLQLNDDDFLLWARCMEFAASLGEFYGKAGEFAEIDLKCLKVWDRNKVLELLKRLEKLSIKVAKVRAIYGVNNIREYYRLFCGKWIVDCGYIELTEYYVYPMLSRSVCNNCKCLRILELLSKTANYILEDYEQEELIGVKRV